MRSRRDAPVFRLVRVVPAALVVSFTLVACGAGGDGAGDVEAFCDLVGEQERIDVADDPEAARAAFVELGAVAPPEVSDDLEVVLGTFSELAELDEAALGDGDAFGEALATLFDTEFITAAERLDSFAADECGLDLSGDDPPADDPTSSEGGSSELDEADAGADGLITEAADVPDPLFDPLFDGDVVDPEVMSIDGLRYHLDVDHTDSPWRTRLTAFGMGGVVSVGGIELDDDAAEVCAAVAEYVARFDPDAEIRIESYVVDDGGAIVFDRVLVAGDAIDGC